jgi:THO complex subunit 2
LLSIGDLPPALSILIKYRWMVDANPQLADLILRILKCSISTLYESALVIRERIPGFSQARARYGIGGVQPTPPRKPHLTFWAPTPPCTSMLDFVFFFPDWTERIPVCSTMADLVDTAEPLMRFIGVHVSRDPLFITKFLRLGRQQLATTVCALYCNSYSLFK